MCSIPSAARVFGFCFRGTASGQAWTTIPLPYTNGGCCISNLLLGRRFQMAAEGIAEDGERLITWTILSVVLGPWFCSDNS